MMKLLDDLYIGIPSNLRIDGCVIGNKWVTVRANGNVGVARMLEAPSHKGEEFGGKWLRDVGGHLYWDDLTKAAVGMAAINAYHNTPERIANFDGAALCDYSECDGKKTAVVGECPIFAMSGKSADAFDLPMFPDFDKAAYEALKGYDIVVISADTLTTRALPGLLDIIGEDGYVIIDGISAPASALFFAFDMPVKKVNGYFCRFDYTMEDAARHDLEHVEAGLYTFSICPLEVPYVHEHERMKNFNDSPYSAWSFNNSFGSDWGGKEYDKASFDKIYKG